MGNVNAIRSSRWRCLRLASIAFAALVAACASPPPAYPDLPRLRVSTAFGSRNICGLGISPRISIDKAPATTTQYRLRLTDMDVLFQTPWQVTLEAKPGGFAEGDILDYQAPCVGDLRLYSSYWYHQYRLEVLALDAQNRPVAYGSTTAQVRSINSTLDSERASQRRATPGSPSSQPEPQAPPPPIIGPGLGINEYNSIGPVSPLLVPQVPAPVE